MVVGCIGGVGLICELWVQFMIYGYGFVGDVVLELDCVVVVVVDFFFFFFFFFFFAARVCGCGWWADGGGGGSSCG